MECEHAWSSLTEGAFQAWAKVLGRVLAQSTAHGCGECGALRLSRPGRVAVVRPSAMDRSNYERALGLVSVPA